MTVKILEVDSFDETLAGADKPLLVEFGADWCGPCRQMEPVLARLAGELEDEVEVCTINFDDNLSIGRRYDVMSLPTLILFVDGQPVRRLVGARGVAHLRQELADHLEPLAARGR